MRVCHDHKLDEVKQVERTLLDCPSHCNLLVGKELKGKSRLVPGSNGNFNLKLSNDKVVDNFCLGYECSSNNGSWVTTYEACECKDLALMAKKMKLQYSKVPFCCNSTGVLHVNDQNCYDNETMMHPKETESKGAYKCSWRTKQKFQVVKQDDLKSYQGKITCIGIMKTPKESFLGGVICTSACKGKETCFESCNSKGKAWTGSDYKPSDRNITFSEIVGLDVDERPEEGNINYGSVQEKGHAPCQENYKSQQIFPDDNCYDSAEFSKNGDLLFPERNITLQYKEFCIVPTIKNHPKGRFMIQACFPKQEVKAKFSFYFIILSISITCLIITVLVYTFFRDALLRSSYNKIMINFACSLLLAFLTLVILQMHGSGFSKFGCTILGHFNQFFFLATFTWMTIMSYEIFKQIHGMSHFVGRHNSSSIMKQIVIGYGVPLLVVLVTVIVELTAPRCSSYSPRFGHKYFHFH